MKSDREVKGIFLTKKNLKFEVFKFYLLLKFFVSKKDVYHSDSSKLLFINVHFHICKPIDVLKLFISTNIRVNHLLKPLAFRHPQQFFRKRFFLFFKLQNLASSFFENFIAISFAFSQFFLLLKRQLNCFLTIRGTRVFHSLRTRITLNK